MPSRFLPLLGLPAVISCSALLAALPGAAGAAVDGKIQVLLFGDSTTEGSVPRRVRPQGPHLEDMIRMLLAQEKDLPPCNVVNLGVSGEFIRKLLDSGRYDRAVAKHPGVDYIFLRYGWCDAAYRENFDENFTKDYAELIARLRKDYPGVTVIVSSFIPVENQDERIRRINTRAEQAAREAGAPYFDFTQRYAAEQKRSGPKALCYRRLALAKIPEKYHEIVKPFTSGNPPEVVALDNELDAILTDVPGWMNDIHPNLAGYNVIADESAKFLAKLLRERQAKKE